jgi:hypothetical protein
MIALASKQGVAAGKYLESALPAQLFLCGTRPAFLPAR